MSHAAQHRTGKIAVATGADGPSVKYAETLVGPLSGHPPGRRPETARDRKPAATGSTGSARSSRKRSGHTSKPRTGESVPYALPTSNSAVELQELGGAEGI